MQNSYTPVGEDPPTSTNRWTWILDVDDAPMLRKRELVMNICIVQVMLSFVLLTNWRRSPVLLVLHPFFIGAGVLGYLGAKHCRSVFVAAHFMGSAGLALVFLIFILAETFLKNTRGHSQANADLFFIILNAPMDLFLLSTSGASVVLYLSLKQLKRQLSERRAQIREQFESVQRADSSGSLGLPPGMVGIELTEAGAAAEMRRRFAKQDLRCPITLEVMHDPVIAGDGQSYEREAIERWLRNHRTSPLTGRVLPSLELIPNHRLRTLIHDIVESGGAITGRSELPSSSTELPSSSNLLSPR